MADWPSKKLADSFGKLQKDDAAFENGRILSLPRTSWKSMRNLKIPVKSATRFAFARAKSTQKTIGPWQKRTKVLVLASRSKPIRAILAAALPNLRVPVAS